MKSLSKTLLEFIQKIEKKYKKRQLRKKVKSLRDSGMFFEEIQRIQLKSKKKFIYLMGCGRSGTWLLTSLFSTFSNLNLFAKEVPIEYFGVLESDSETLVLKRYHKSYECVRDIPPSIGIVWIVRHPFDVLTSHNPNNSSAKFHIKPHRFLGEMQALQYLVETKRENTLIVKYEDLIKDPSVIQSRIADKFGLNISINAHDATKFFNAPPEAVAAMHGLRPIENQSTRKYLNDPEKIKYLQHILPEVTPCLDWLAKEFGYDLELP